MVRLVIWDAIAPIMTSPSWHFLLFFRRRERGDVISNTCSLYNYADDNTLGYCHPVINILNTKLEDESEITLNWFDEKHMKANISQFQSIILRPNGIIDDTSFWESGYTLRPVSCVNLLGVKIDDRISFGKPHIFHL